jgi:hypothetical protein
MRCDQIIDAIIIYIERNNIVTDETFLRRQQLMDLFCSARARVLSQFMIQRVGVTGKNYLKSVIDKTVYEQGGTFNYFEVQSAVMNEYEYVGGIDGCSRFRENLTISQYQNSINKQVPSITLYYKEDTMLKVDNNQVETILVNYIPVNPVNVPTFNYELDEFPLDDAMIDIVFNEMFETYQKKVIESPKDTVSDSQDTIKSIIK